MRVFLLLALIISNLPTIIPSQAHANALFRGHSYEVHTVSFSSDGQYLASGSGDKTVIVWNLRTNEPVMIIRDHKRTVYAVAFSKVHPDLLATSSSDGELIIWDIFRRRKIANLQAGDTTSDGVLSLDFSPTLNTLAVGTMGGRVHLWDVDELTQMGHADQDHMGGFTLSVKFSKDGSRLYSVGGSDGKIFAHDAQNGAVINQYKDTNSYSSIWDITIHPDGHQFYSVNSDGQLVTWDTSSPTPVRHQKIHDFLAQSVEISRDGKQLYVGVAGFNNQNENSINIIETDSGLLLQKIDAHKNRVRGMDLSPDGSTLATGAWDYLVKTWTL